MQIDTDHATATKTGPESAHLSKHWIHRIDQWCEQIGDRLNPILIKETRQALKSRQFVFTFFSLLFAALGWTVVGSLSRMPEIYTTPSAPSLLIGYYVVLAIPMLLIVPIAAYRSLEVEIDDGTLELLSISALTPWQIILGKLSSATLQILLYFIALLPCVSYAYTLRGVDLTVIFLMIFGLLIAGLLLTIFAIFLASLSRSRTGRIVTLLLTMIILLIVEVIIGTLMVDLIQQFNGISTGILFSTILSTLLISLSLGHLLLTATAAQLTPESENRSTPLRWSILAVNSTLVLTGVLGLTSLGRNGIIVFVATQFSIGVLWTLSGAMLVSESSTMTLRIQRNLPGSWLSRSLFSWMSPGPVNGLVFTVLNVVILVTLVDAWTQWLSSTQFSNDRSVVRDIEEISKVSKGFASYLIFTLVLVHWLIRMLRRRQQLRIEIGIVALIVITLLMALAPYAIGLHLNEYRPYSYSYWQMTNWAWTLSRIHQSPTSVSIFMIQILAAGGFLITVLRSPEIFRPRRTATPQRVQQEIAIGNSQPREADKDFDLLGIDDSV